MTGQIEALGIKPRKRENTRKRLLSCFRAFVASFVVATGLPAPASAANKEHQQLAADIRMLQEQMQLLQNMLGTLNDSLKAVNTRLDDQTNTMRKAFADQKLLIDNLSSDPDAIVSSRAGSGGTTGGSATGSGGAGGRLAVVGGGGGGGIGRATGGVLW